MMMRMLLQISAPVLLAMQAAEGKPIHDGSAATPSAGELALVQQHRILEDTCEESEMVVDHDLAQTTQEIQVYVKTYPGDRDGLFDITLTGPPYAAVGESITAPGWCIDYDRFISTGNYQMDVFSGFDADIHSDAVDKPAMLPNLAWMINHINVGEAWTEDVNGQPCSGTITWKEYQGAVWQVIDDQNGNGWLNQKTCISDGIALRAKAEGNNYEPNCANPNEQVPLVYVVDEGTGDEIQNQVIMSETPLASIAGMCECDDGKTTTDEPMTTTSKPGTKGDPHFKTHGGEMYDFHGGCDLVLLDNPDFNNGLGMTIHIRTKVETWWSYVQSAVVRIGDETVEINGDNADNWLYTNGLPAVHEGEQWKTGSLGGLLLRSRKGGSAGRETHIHLGDGQKITLKAFNKFVKVELFAAGEDVYHGSHGLLGRFPDGKRVSRDGETLVEDVNAFGQEWQVGVEEPKLFRSYSDKWVVPAGQTCAMPDSSTAKKQLRKRRLASGIPTKDAEKACAHLFSEDDRKACVFDVISTQDTNMAAVW